MAIARVVSFEGVSRDRIEQIKNEIESDEQPDDVPATEFVLLHDGGGDESLAILFFETEEDYATGDAALNAMPSEDTPGRRTSVKKYDVVGRMTR